jgi:hypothetical protein
MSRNESVPHVAAAYHQLESLLRSIGPALVVEGYPAERLEHLIGVVGFVGAVNSGECHSAPDDDSHAPF